MKKLVALFVLVALVAGGWYVASPWWALKGLRDAAVERDVAELERRVDFPAMRQSLRREMGEALRERATGGGPLDVLAARAAEEFGGAAVDQLVRPGAIANVITTGAIASRFVPEDLRDRELDWTVERDGIDSFRALGTFEGGMAGPTLVFSRDGIGWRLVGVALP